MAAVQSELVRIAAELETSLMAKTGRLGAAAPIVAQSEDLQVRFYCPAAGCARLSTGAASVACLSLAAAAWSESNMPCLP